MRTHKAVLLGLLATSFAYADVSTVSPVKNPAPLSEPSAKEVKVESKEEAFKKPAWLTELSLTVKESYDSNVYATEAGDLSNRDSAITTFMPKIEVNFSKLIEWDKEDEKLLDTLSLAYAPEFALYHGDEQESFKKHNITNKFKGKSGKLSYSADNTFTYVDGSRDSVIYPTLNAFSNGAPRERRNQIQDRANVTFKYDFTEHCFIRPTASLLYYDLLTKHQNVAGHQNFIDRYDVNGGADFGYNINKDLAFITGYRFGAQDHDHTAFTTVNQSSTYHRALVGLEGKIVKWLKISTLVGPDFRNYTQTSSVGDSTRLYAEGKVEAEATSKDKFMFETKVWQWVSSTGTSSYLDNSYTFTYQRKFTDDLKGSVGFKIWNLDYDNPTLRDDTLYVFPVSLSYAINKNMDVTAEYQHSWGENNVDSGNPQGREFDRHIASLAFKVKL
jgi:hypothetical protein